jgi:hypothetical protein
LQYTTRALVLALVLVLVVAEIKAWDTLVLPLVLRVRLARLEYEYSV